MTTPTCTQTVSPDETRAVLVRAAPLLRCSICHQAAENLVKSRARLELHPVSGATGSRDAP
jgi:hypothetical protein